jgi:ribosomal protein S18 acetylase RimI-like enzyme/ADP-ribose pyrophosphatase YjhB (NUDIX family)
VIIRGATEIDQDAIWEIFRAVVAGRDTYVFPPETPRDEGVGYWFGPDVTSFVAEIDGRVVGMCKVIPNRRGLGSHVSNASFMVHPAAAGRGVGRAMGSHCLVEARRQGYDAMQFNFVVATNTRAVALWRQLGFQIIATLPRAFQHGTLGLVDAYVMHRTLDDIVLTFGELAEMATPVVRPSAYAVVADQSRRIAIIRSSGNVMLPGGAVDGNESREHAARREVAEECAVDAVLTGSLGNAVQYVRARTPQPVEKRSEFFAAVRPVPIDGATAEHETLWMTAADAERAVTSESHAWAIRRWARLNT